jgi:hypothetical protein
MQSLKGQFKSMFLPLSENYYEQQCWKDKSRALKCYFKVPLFRWPRDMSKCVSNKSKRAGQQTFSLPALYEVSTSHSSILCTLWREAKVKALWSGNTGPGFKPWLTKSLAQYKEPPGDLGSCPALPYSMWPQASPLPSDGHIFLIHTMEETWVSILTLGHGQV